MPRGGSTLTLAALSAALVRPAIFVCIAFANETVYFWTGLGQIAWGGNTWTGAGDLGKIGMIEEGSTVQAKGLTLELTGVPSSELSEVMNNIRLQQPAQIYLAGRNADGSVIDVPVLSFAGMVDGPEIQDEGNTCTINLNLEDVLIDLNRAVNRRYTQQDAALINPLDQAFSFVVGIQELTTYWGIVPSSNQR